MRLLDLLHVDRDKEQYSYQIFSKPPICPSLLGLPLPIWGWWAFHRWSPDRCRRTAFALTVPFSGDDRCPSPVRSYTRAWPCRLETADEVWLVIWGSLGDSGHWFRRLGLNGGHKHHGHIQCCASTWARFTWSLALPTSAILTDFIGPVGRATAVGQLAPHKRPLQLRVGRRALECFSGR